MGMKLISPLVNKDKQQEEIARKLLRSQEVERLAQDSNTKLARAEADFADALARSNRKWAEEVQKQQKESQEMEKEVENLENRKKQALIPIEIYKKEADAIMQEAETLAKMAKEKVEYCDQLQEELEQKLTDVADREKDVEYEEQRQEIAKQAITAQQNEIRDGTKRLSEEMVLFHEKLQIADQKIEERKRAVFLEETTLNAKNEKYKRDVEALRIFEIQLKDKEATLIRALERVNKAKKM